MTLPGAGPPTAAERALAALKSQSVNTGRGAVQTRSTTRRPPTEPYHAPPVASGPIGAAIFRDNTGSSAAQFFLDPSTAGSTVGDASSISYDASEVAIMVSEVGWYSALASIGVTGAGPLTHPIAVLLEPPGGIVGNVTGWYPTDAMNWNDMGVACPPMYVDSVPDWFYVDVRNPSANVNVTGSVYVVRLA